MVCIQTIMCYIIKVNNDLPDQRSVDVNVYFSFINLIFLCICLRARVRECALQCTSTCRIYIWPRIQKHTSESFIPRSIQYWCLWILEIPTITKIEPSIFITLIDIIYYQTPRKLSCVFFFFYQGLDLQWKSHLNGYTWRWSHVFS